MALSAIGRKALLEHGTQTKIAAQLSLSDGFVSAVVLGDDLPKTRKGWKNYRRVQLAIARELGLDVTEAFTAFERGEVQQEAVAAV